MGEVENGNDFTILFSLLSDEAFKGINIHFPQILGVGIIMHNPGTIQDTKGHVIVSPHHIRKNDSVSGINPQIGKCADTMGDTAGNNWKTDLFSFKGRIFLKQGTLPHLSESWNAKGGCVGKVVIRFYPFDKGCHGRQ